MIRKLSQPNSNQAVVASSDTALDLSINTDVSSSLNDNSSADIQQLVDLKIPSKTILNNTDLKNLKVFRAVRTKLKQQAMKDEFVNQVSGVLDLFDKNDNKYESEITQFVCSVAEDFFISHPKMGLIKEDAVVQCVSKYFNDDKELVKTIIQLVLPNITKTNIFRRNKQKIYNFFLLLLDRFS